MMAGKDVKAEADAVFAALHRRLPVKLFTVTVHDPDAALARRAYTSHPVEYPVSGTKPVTRDPWHAVVIEGRKSFVANTPEGYSGLFPDHAVIAALGCGSVINVPVIRDDGAVVATVNLLDRAGYFTPDKVAEAEAAVTAGRAALLRAIAAAS